MRRLIFTIIIEILAFYITVKAVDATDTLRHVIIEGKIIGQGKRPQVLLTTHYFTEIDRDITIQPDYFGSFRFDVAVPFISELFLITNGAYATLILEPGDSIFLLIDRTKDPIITFHGDKELFNTEINAIENYQEKTMILDNQEVHVKNDSYYLLPGYKWIIFSES